MNQFINQKSVITALTNSFNLDISRAFKVTFLTINHSKISLKIKYRFMMSLRKFRKYLSVLMRFPKIARTRTAMRMLFHCLKLVYIYRD